MIQISGAMMDRLLSTGQASELNICVTVVYFLLENVDYVTSVSKI